MSTLAVPVGAGLPPPRLGVGAWLERVIALHGPPPAPAAEDDPDEATMLDVALICAAHF